MKDLSEKSLEEALVNIRAMQMLSPNPITIKPTKLIMVPYPDETREQFEIRCVAAINMISKYKVGEPFPEIFEEEQK